MTLLKAGPCVVTQVKDGPTDGYKAVQAAALLKRAMLELSRG